MAGMKKLRKDSKIARLAEAEREELDALLLGGGVGLQEAQAWLAERGVQVSAQSVSEYYRLHVLPGKWRRMEASAAVLNKVKADDVADAARRAMAQRVFELSVDTGADPKLLATFYKLMLDGEAMAQNGRRLALLEKKAAAADAARHAAEDTGMDAEGKLARIREIFGLA